MIAFTKKAMRNKNPEDMSNSTIKVLLNKQNDGAEESSSSSEQNKTVQQKTEEERQRIISLLENTKIETKKALTQKQRAELTRMTCQVAKKKK